MQGPSDDETRVSDDVAAANPQVALVEPYGRRSCDEGGRWENCHARPEWHQGLEAVRVVSRQDDDFRLLKKEIGRLMKAATRGDLVYGKTHDVVKLSSADLVLELRFGQRVEYPEGLRAVRLYFSEPDCETDVMLAVKLAAKPATADGLDLQNDHIADAQKYVEDHYRGTGQR